MSEPICLKCQGLVWQGFLAHCVNMQVDDSIFEEAMELKEVIEEGRSEKEIAVIEKQQDLRFETSLANRLMAIPYIVWKRKGVIKYYEDAPKTPEECPFGFKARTDTSKPQR